METGFQVAASNSADAKKHHPHKKQKRFQSFQFVLSNILTLGSLNPADFTPVEFHEIIGIASSTSADRKKTLRSQEIETVLNNIQHTAQTTGRDDFVLSFFHKKQPDGFWRLERNLPESCGLWATLPDLVLKGNWRILQQYVIGGTCQSLGGHARDMRFKYSNLILSKLILLLSLRKQFFSRMDINGQDN